MISTKALTVASTWDNPKQNKSLKFLQFEYMRSEKKSSQKANMPISLQSNRYLLLLKNHIKEY